MRAIVTGSTNGIGEAIARRLAGEGLTVVLVGRDDARLRSARDRIVGAISDADLELEQADLARLDEVRELADRLSEAPPPGVVISNAALVAPLDRRTPDGVPRVLMVNHLAPYVLMRRLAEALRGRRARFVVVGAEPVSLARSPVDLDDLMFSRPEHLGEPVELRPFYAYGRTKNMNVMFVYALAHRLDGTGITVNGAHPGIIGGTGLSREVPGLTALVAERFRFDPADLPDPDTGADTPAWLATSPDVDGVTGRFFVDRRAVETASHTTDPARTDRLWSESAALVGLPVDLACAHGR
ncbi:SDR family NAD(P)-dependent oxidoreductase [Pseudonocardia alaniniphila]|uniref:SDR family NAD(P)-dependent oxidoreductase n=1 Tax=Pseudonocardia alaniniphila TaxID=75291 RepID=A0ABS9TSE8_9PSEU|nr:SDR family NAD(P)-dependent oxidoreductase [Pseudonocardia alaniniphila]MCH6171156.1 SDR family NAD(P)-dependent oxidoreductase [Pseudonocardia alaniniphila]